MKKIKDIPEQLAYGLTYNEAIRSYTAKRLGIDNTPFQENLDQMLYTAKFVWEPMRLAMGVPVYVASFFRCLLLNLEISTWGYTSQHLAMPMNTKLSGFINDGGSAIDVDADRYGRITNKQIFFYYVDNDIPFDKLIWEKGSSKNPGWIHVSGRQGHNRGIIKRILPQGDEIILNSSRIERLR